MDSIAAACIVAVTNRERSYIRFAQSIFIKLPQLRADLSNFSGAFSPCVASRVPRAMSGTAFMEKKKIKKKNKKAAPKSERGGQPRQAPPGLALFCLRNNFFDETRRLCRSFAEGSIRDGHIFHERVVSASPFFHPCSPPVTHSTPRHATLGEGGPTTVGDKNHVWRIRGKIVEGWRSGVCVRSRARRGDITSRNKPARVTEEITWGVRCTVEVISRPHDVRRTCDPLRISAWLRTRLRRSYAPVTVVPRRASFSLGRRDVARTSLVISCDRVPFARDDGRIFNRRVIYPEFRMSESAANTPRGV